MLRLLKSIFKLLFFCSVAIHVAGSRNKPRHSNEFELLDTVIITSQVTLSMTKLVLV
jgi:hypothetical protein